MKHEEENHESENETRFSKLLFSKPSNFAAKLKPKDTASIPSDRKAAWVDDDDESFDATAVHKANKKGLYKDTLKRKYETLIGTPSWARLDKKLREDEKDNGILRSVSHTPKIKSANLPKDYLEIKGFPKLRNMGDSSTVSCLEFHPTATVVLMGTRFGNVSLFSVGGDVNNKIHSFQLKGYRLSTAHFSPDGNECFISSESKRDYCVYDLIKAEPNLVQLPYCVAKPKVFVVSPDGQYIAISCGFQEMFLISAASKELLREMKHNSNVQALAFSSESDKIYSYCEQGEVCIWDLSTFRVVKKFFDHGCVTASMISTSPCGRLLATGSGEGIVNIYETDKLTTREPIPLKTIKNLKSQITHLKFNSSTEILSLASSILPDAVKLAQIPSYHVFANFPSPQFSMNNVETINFSPNSGFMGVSNNKGCVHLFRLKHYNNY